MTERDRWDLRGPVQSCRLERTWYGTRRVGDVCERVEHGDTAIVEFRRDGGLARRSQHSWNGSEWTSTYEYDDSGRLVIVREHNASGPVHFRRYEYDSAGRLERLIAR